jgi:hypothetical protein
MLTSQKFGQKMPTVSTKESEDNILEDQSFTIINPDNFSVAQFSIYGSKPNAIVR